MTAGDLHDALARLGADLMARALAAAERGSLTLTPQPATGVTYAAKIDKDETRIDWTKPARQVHNHIRGLSPFPGAWFELGGVRDQGAALDARRGRRRAGHACSTIISPSLAATARCGSRKCSAPASSR